jgi:hypothetical protein
MQPGIDDKWAGFDSKIHERQPVKPIVLMFIDVVRNTHNCD